MYFEYHHRRPFSVFKCNICVHIEGLWQNVIKVYQAWLFSSIYKERTVSVRSLCVFCVSPAHIITSPGHTGGIIEARWWPAHVPPLSLACWDHFTICTRTFRSLHTGPEQTRSCENKAGFHTWLNAIFFSNGKIVPSVNVRVNSKLTVCTHFNI